MNTEATSNHGYRELAANRQFMALSTGMFLGRTASSMWLVTLVLILELGQHNPALAGIALFIGLVPGLCLSPIAGALLDRRGRRLLVLLDYSVAALAVLLIAGLLISNHLATWALLLLTLVSGVTGPLSGTGLRTLLPILLPRHLWDRGNAVDSSTGSLAGIAGPALAGILYAGIGGSGALFVVVLFYASAAALLIFVPDPAPTKSSAQSVLRDAAQGVAYVFGNRSLRTLGFAFFAGNAASGILLVTLPLVATREMHGGSTLVGLALASMSALAIVSGFLLATRDTENRERVFMAVGFGCAVLGYVVLAFAASPIALFVGCGIIGLATGPASIAGFSLRQRRSDPAWFGRAFAIHASLNYIGMPVGSIIGGLVSGISLPLAVAVGGVALGLASVISLQVPRRGEPMTPR